MIGIEPCICEVMNLKELLKKELKAKRVDPESSCFCKGCNTDVSTAHATTYFYELDHYKDDTAKTPIINVVTCLDAAGL